MASIFTDDEKKQFKEVWKLFDKDGTGTVANKDVGTMIRAAGENLTEGEVMDHVADTGGSVDFNSFLEMMAKQSAASKDSEEEIVECFKVFDQEGKGYIAVSELKHIMTSLGEKLDDDEVTEMVSEATIEDGKVKYAELVKILMAG
ncbi:Myosin light chain 1/3, skeletal muscle isoform [Seminavis robusta]|uniref:Calmodulin n=1 Tax=Seminavis robusta TaxID=568900 RepID=A0A9N8F2M1_9STRA|nr:Myosin light chain 1/3, skeletal muscle isoform [Seminavis robusta]|eukprot:Sro2763_g336500.1 Myosin light chain 1/3, skeletal muscle isoform (146) ;mRNA; f:1231-1668